MELYKSKRLPQLEVISKSKEQVLNINSVKYEKKKWKVFF